MLTSKKSYLLFIRIKENYNKLHTIPAPCDEKNLIIILSNKTIEFPYTTKETKHTWYPLKNISPSIHIHKIQSLKQNYFSHPYKKSF